METIHKPTSESTSEEPFSTSYIAEAREKDSIAASSKLETSRIEKPRSNEPSLHHQLSFADYRKRASEYRHRLLELWPQPKAWHDLGIESLRETLTKDFEFIEGAVQLIEIMRAQDSQLPQLVERIDRIDQDAYLFVEILEVIAYQFQRPVPERDSALTDKINKKLGAFEREYFLDSLQTLRDLKLEEYNTVIESLNDSEARTDSIGFKPYTNALAEFLLSKGTTPPLTISIEGAWGSGKSSFMRQLEQRIKNSTDSKIGPLTVWFNPWRYDDREALWAVFALEFIQSIKHQLNHVQRIRGWVRYIRERIRQKETRWSMSHS